MDENVISDGSNRRELLKGAAGIAAVATVGGLLVRPEFATAAPSTAPPGLYCSIPSLPGPSQGFKLFSMTWNASLPLSAAGAGGQSSGKPELSSIRMTKLTDLATNALIKAMLTSNSVGNASITFADNTNQVKQAFDLTGVRVVSLGISSGDEPLFEELELAYATVSFVQNGASTVSYNLSSGIVS